MFTPEPGEKVEGRRAWSCKRVYAHAVQKAMVDFILLKGIGMFFPLDQRVPRSLRCRITGDGGRDDDDGGDEEVKEEHDVEADDVQTETSRI